MSTRCWFPVGSLGGAYRDKQRYYLASSCLLGLLTVVEHDLAIGVDSVDAEVIAGAVYGFGLDHIHRLIGRDTGSFSVHFYSSPWWRMGQYSVRADGVLHRCDQTDIQSDSGRGHRLGEPFAARRRSNP
jgi:hypothetical protein